MEPFQFATTGSHYWPLLIVGVFVLWTLWKIKSHARHDNDMNSHGGAINKKQSLAASGATGGATSGAVTNTIYDDPPTIKVSGSQRVDRLHRVVSLQAGEHIDLLDLTFDRIPRLRIGFIGFEPPSDTSIGSSSQRVRLHIDLGGASAGCGSLVKEVGTNEFLLPLATTEEHRCSILHFQGQEDEVSFLRVKLLRMDVQQQRVDVDVLHVCGNWSH